MSQRTATHREQCFGQADPDGRRRTKPCLKALVSHDGEPAARSIPSWGTKFFITRNSNLILQNIREGANPSSLSYYQLIHSLLEFFLFQGPGYFGVRVRSRLPLADQARRIPFAFYEWKIDVFISFHPSSMISFLSIQMVKNSLIRSI